MPPLAFDLVLSKEAADFGIQRRIGSPAGDELGYRSGIGRRNVFANTRHRVRGGHDQHQ
jgi:hypothetical protein